MGDRQLRDHYTQAQHTIQKEQVEVVVGVMSQDQK